MSLRRRFTAALALLALAGSLPCGGSAGSRAWAGEPPAVPAPQPDPSPLTGAPPTNARVDRAVQTLDALQGRASARAYAESVAASQEGEPPAPPLPAGGRAGLPAQASVTTAMVRLKDLAAHTESLPLEPCLETASVIAAERWEWTAVQFNDVRLSGAGAGTGTPFFSGRFRPSSMDDLPPVLPVHVRRSTVVVPSPAAAPPAPPSGIPLDFVAKGVLVGFDDDALRAAMAGPKAPGPEAAARTEAALLVAGEGEGAVALVAGLEAGPVPSEDARVRSVSLRRLLADARAGRSRGASLEGVVRLVGVVREPDGDVRLLGRDVPGAPPLLVDDVVTTLAAVWRDGLTPACSLDPEPSDPAGPQHVRVLGVRSSSPFAKTMLEADYEMKKVLGGVDDLGIEGLRSLLDLLLDAPEPERTSRFWLCPVPLRPGDLALSADGRVLSLTCTVQTRTERLLLGEHGARGTGVTSPAAETAAEGFSARYEAVAAARPVFRRLQGLFDLVLAVRALRALAPADPLLTEVAGLATQDVEVPATYPGIAVTRSRGGATVTLSGGCEVSVPFERRALRRLPDADAGSFLAAAAADGPSVVRRPTPSPTAEGAPPADGLAAATMALVRGDAAEAVAQADAVLDRDPADARARAVRAEAFRAAGRPEAALRDALAAEALEPDDLGHAALVRRLRMDAEGEVALAGASPAVRAEVARTELAVAASSLVAEDAPAALLAAKRALLAVPGGYEASAMAAAAAWVEGRFPEAEEHASQAAQARPRETEPLRLRALVRLATGRVAEARSDLDAALALGEDADARALRAFARLLADDLAGAADDAERAAALSPRSDLATGAATAVCTAARLPREAAHRSVEDLFRLPPKAMLAFGGGVAAAEQGRGSDAAAGFEKALALLDAAGGPPTTARARAELALLALLPSTVASGRDPAEVSAKVEALGAALEARGDVPSCTAFARASAALQLGDREAAYGFLEAAVAGLSRPDVLLPEMMPGGAAGAEAVFRFVQLGIAIGSPDGLLSDPRILEILDRLQKVLAGGPGATAAAAFAELVSLVRAAPDHREGPEVRETMRRRSAEVVRGLGGHVALADAFVVSIWLQAAAAAEAQEADLAAAGAAAKDLWSVPLEDDTASVARAAIPRLRAQAAQALFARWLRDLGGGPAADGAGLDEPEGRARFEQTRAQWLAEAASLGEPAFTALVEEHFARIEADAADKALTARRARIERVLEVAAPGSKRDRLTADLAHVTSDLARRSVTRGEATRARIAAAYAATTTRVQMWTLDAVLAELARAGGPDAPHYVPPPDAGLSALKASLERVRARAKEGR